MEENTCGSTSTTNIMAKVQVMVALGEGRKKEVRKKGSLIDGLQGQPTAIAKDQWKPGFGEARAAPWLRLRQYLALPGKVWIQGHSILVGENKHMV